jgi:hypothetical protein
VSLKISPEARSRAHEEHGIDLPVVVIVVLLWCYFGWCGASLAFNAFTIWLNEVLTPLIDGVHDTYVDDLVGFGHPATAD